MVPTRENCSTGLSSVPALDPPAQVVGASILGHPREASGRLVGPPVFKTGERLTQSLAGSIPVRLRRWIKGGRLP